MARIHYLRNDALRTVRPGFAGNKLFGNQFANGEELFTPRLSDVLRWQLSTNPQKEEKKRDTWTPPVVSCEANLNEQADDFLIWLGHSSFLLCIENTRLLFDPVLFSSLGLRHRHPLPCRPEALQGIDLLLLSHGHRDHLDEQSIRLLAGQNPAMQVLTGLRAGTIVKPWLSAGNAVQEAGWWQQYDIDWEGMGWAEPANPPCDIYYLPAAHWHRRGLSDTNEVLWGSFLIRARQADKLIFFAGDTAYAGHFEAIEQQFGPLDIVLMPIGAYKPAFMMNKSHVDPHEAAKAANILRAGHLVPMHHGTFDLSDEPASEPLRLLRGIAGSGMLRGELHAPAVGEVLRWAEWE